MDGVDERGGGRNDGVAAEGGGVGRRGEDSAVEAGGSRELGSSGSECERGGVLGVAVRIDTGRRIEKNTLQAFKSMYGSQKPALKLKKLVAAPGGA